MMSPSERVLLALGRLQEETAGTTTEPLVTELVAALAADTTVADLRQEVEFAKAAVQGCEVCGRTPAPGGFCSEECVRVDAQRRSAARRFEVSLPIGPCTESESEDFLVAVVGFAENYAEASGVALGSVGAIHPWTDDDGSDPIETGPES